VAVLSGYNLRERGAKLWKASEEKWACRRQRLVLEKRISQQQEEDLLAYAPSEVISLINQMTRLCPRCKKKRMSSEHLMMHNVVVSHPIKLLK